MLRYLSICEFSCYSFTDTQSTCIIDDCSVATGQDRREGVKVIVRQQGSGVLSTIVDVRTQTIFSYASSAILRTCYSLSVHVRTLVNSTPGRTPSATTIVACEIFHKP